MADARFHPSRRGPFRLAVLARTARASLHNPADGDRLARDLASLETAGEGDVSVLHNRKYLSAFAASRAEACFIADDDRLKSAAPPGMALLCSPTPHLSYALAARAFYPQPNLKAEISETASVHRLAKLGRRCRVERGAVIAAGADIGDDCLIGPYAVIGAHVEIGAGCRIGAHVSISHALLGREVVVRPGARIGQAGFGFASDDKGNFIEVPQLGLVRIGDRCLIGANSTVDRGSLGDTLIGDSCQIDNLVQIAHNVTLGPGCVLAAQVGAAGSTHFGAYCMVGGQAGFAGHVSIGNHVHVGAQSGVRRDTPDGARIFGTPAMPMEDWKKRSLALARVMRGASRARTTSRDNQA